jgi:glucose-1-phosphate thymidylyltransferase
MSEELIGLIPAAGKGMRLGLPYPKELYPIIRDNHYKPIAQFVVQNLVEASINHIVFVVNETKHQLIGYFGNGQRFDCNFSYVVQETRANGEESTSPGLAHALDSAYHLTRHKTVCFGMADTIMQPTDVFARSLAAAAPDDDVILALWMTNRPEKFGMVAYDASGRVAAIVDKPLETNLTEMWGAIVWRPRFTEHLHQSVRENGISDFALIMNSAIEQGMNVRAVPMPAGTYIDLGTYDEIMELDKRFREA